MSKPTLKPYPAYKPAAVPWLQQVPEQWGEMKVKYIFRERVQKDYPNEPLLAATQSKGVVTKEAYGLRTVEAQKDLHLLKLVEKGDFVISLRSFQGGIEVSYARGIISPAYTILRTARPCDPGYLKFLLKSAPFIDGLKLFITGIREGQNIDYVRLARTPLPWPSVEEQHLIVRYLHALDAKVKRYIRTKRTLIARLQEQKQAIIQRAVTRGLDPNVKLKPSGVEWLGVVPEHWEELPLKRIARFENTGSWGHDSGEVEVPVATTAQIDRDGNFKVDAMPRRFFSSAEATRYTCTAGDILVVKSSGSMANVISGKCGIIRTGIEPFVFSNFLLRVRAVKTAIRPEYLFLLLRSHITRERIKRMVSGSTYPNLKVGEYTAAMFPIPKLVEQDAILARLMAEVGGIDRAESLVAQDIAAMQEYHTRLIADVVTGAVDVTAAAKAMAVETTEVMEEEPLSMAAEGEAEYGESEE